MNSRMLIGLLLILLAPVVNSAEGDLNWSNTLSAGFTWSTPIILEDRLILQDQDGGLDAFNIINGDKLYSQDLAEAFPTNSPVYANGFVYMIAGDLLKVDPADGSIVGSFSEDTITSQSPAIYNNHIFVGGQTAFYAIDVNTMNIVWSKPINSANVSVKQGILYVFADNLYALNPVTGDEHWRISAPEGNGFYIGSVANGYLSIFENNANTTQLHTYQLNTTTTLAPTLAWSANMGDNSAYNSPPAVDGNIVYAISREGVLRAFLLNGNNGNFLWEETIRSSGSGPALPMALGGIVYIQKESPPDSSEFQLVAIEGTTGNQLWSTQVAGMGVAWGSPVLKDGQVYLATDHGGTLYSFNAGNVAGQWPMLKGNAELTGSSVPGLIAEVDAGTLKITIPQVYVTSSGVFSVQLDLLDADTLTFTIDPENLLPVELPISDIANFNSATNELHIPYLYMGDSVFNAKLLLTGSTDGLFQFKVTDVK